MMAGGQRKGSGRRSRWGEATIPVRVPVSLVDEVKAFLDLKAGVLNAPDKAKPVLSEVEGPDEPIPPRRKPQVDPEEGLITCHECIHLSVLGQCLNAKACGLARELPPGAEHAKAL